MFDPIALPFGAKMLFNTANLRPGVKFEDVAEGSLNVSKAADEHHVIVTDGRSFEEHERSHADATFRNKFEALARMGSETNELGYEMLWQGEGKGQG